MKYVTPENMPIKTKTKAEILEKVMALIGLIDDELKGMDLDKADFCHEGLADYVWLVQEITGERSSVYDYIVGADLEMAKDLVSKINEAIASVENNETADVVSAITNKVDSWRLSEAISDHILDV